ncbi:MAG TPA: metallophosphoesterase [Xanthobacteraceae bacterium]|nr:metallophosphoesterase [Xanthobacteraceae bacterium]
MFALAHLSDPHLPAIPRPRLIELAGKRGLGLVNWHLRRRREHRAEILEALLADIAAQSPDHIAVTGDLVNVALPGEFASARAFLERLGPPERVSFVPGNHDAYVRAALQHSDTSLRHYVTGDDGAGEGASLYPYFRRRGPLAVIGASTALPTGPFMATGRLGADQIKRLDHLLASIPIDLFRVVLLHHPPISVPGDRLKRLIDARAFRDTLERRGAELVLFGHIHVTSVTRLPGREHTIPAVSVASASATVKSEEPACYHLFRISRENGAWICDMTTRGFAPGRSGIAEIGRRRLAPANQ